jgi:starch synthase (maltosyl-transferring)
MKPVEGRARVVIEAVQPQVDGGRYPVCRIVGDAVTVSAAIFGDGHDHLAAKLLYRQKSDRKWRSVAMADTGNDVWTGTFPVDTAGEWQYTIQAWVDHFDTWRRACQSL